ncbi:hypothetical protein [Salinactinospora qingdaonensis]|uniref:Uncharacterized protein n=1 Tax=Salinactinospora qingdaonensis TaxID=702744 RepID=A0ABP7F8E7_9ACTN
MPIRSTHLATMSAAIAGAVDEGERVTEEPQDGAAAASPELVDERDHAGDAGPPRSYGALGAARSHNGSPA